MYVTMALEAMSLEIFQARRCDSLVRIEAVKMLVGMDFIPDKETIHYEGKLFTT